jgi:hypothetical protein
MFYRTNKPTKWNDDRTRQAFELALLGHTDVEMARVMDVDINTFNSWKRTHPEFKHSLDAGKDEADGRVVHSLFQRATGFTITEMHVCMYKGKVIQTPVPKYYPPDSWAANKWLSVRQRTKWADITKIETNSTITNINKLDMSGVSLEQMKVLRDLGFRQQQLALSNGASQN